MDWGRAKNVLIYAFLLLNLVLGYQLWMNLREQAGSSLDFTSLSENTQRLMEENRIQVLSPIPTETPQLPKIAYIYSSEEQGDPVELNTPVDTKLIYADRKELQNAIGAQIPNLEKYRHDPQSDREHAFVFRPLVNGKWPLFNVELELFHHNQKIEHYRVPKLEIKPTGDVEEQKVLSASKALGTLIERNVIPPKSAVKDIQLGYYGEMFNTEVELAAPAWRFTLDSGEVIYLQGISGDVFTPKSEKSRSKEVMAISFSVLSSGSTGNATIVRNEDTTLLIDAGLSARRIDELMKERDMSGEEIDAILVTHEHSDHIKGLGAVARKYNLPVYANEKTWEAMNKSIGKIAEENRVVLDSHEVKDFGTLRVEPFEISHDAAEPVGYCFYDGDEKLGVATDLGYVSEKVKKAIEGSDVLVLEANHDIEMLRMGRYPWNTKRRILGDMGHLSNVSTGEALSELLTGDMKRVYLAHLSRDHNMMDLAKMTVRDTMEDQGVFFKESEFKLCDTYYDRSTPWDKLKD